jgi:uncharacterized membrane protein
MMGRINLWIVLLLVSVLVNGVLIGAGARTWLAPEPVISDNANPVRSGFQLRRFVEALPPEARARAREDARASRGELRGLLREAMIARRAAAEAVRAEPFDAQAVAEALERSREARAALERATEARILEIADELEPEERQAAFRNAMGPPRPREGDANRRP